MRYDKDHKAETRGKILQVASRRFRAEGIEAVGVASLMASAGLTHGGFYAHFGSKEELVAAACGEGPAELRAYMEKAPAGKRLARLVGGYLSEKHRDEPQQGCVIATLGPEIARHATASRAPFNAAMQTTLTLVEEALQADGYRLDAAAGILSALVGALILARAADDPAQSLAFLDQGRRAALALASRD